MQKKFAGIINLLFTFFVVLLTLSGMMFVALKNSSLDFPQFVFAIDCQGSGECEDLQRQINTLSKDLQSSVNATTNLEQTKQVLESQIRSIRSSIAAAQEENERLVRSIKQREDNLEFQYRLFVERVAEQYRRSKTLNSAALLLGSSSASDATRQYAYWQSARQQDQQLISSIAEDILTLEDDKIAVERRQLQLVAQEAELDRQVSFYEKEISGARAFQADLQGKIASLNARQQAILAEKQGTFQTSVGDVPLADDFNASPAFSPPFSPAFAVFSFGAPHFNGMSQYGAYGRAKEGQSAEDILRAYYGDIEVKKDYDTNTQICVGESTSSCQRMSMEEYVLGIHEVPNGWGDNGGMEALKAQAVAAKSYALADMQRRGFICATESCQVWKSTKKTGNWEKAVQETAGWVMIKNGKPLWSKYASSSGGYIRAYTDSSSTGHTTPAFWDTKSGREGWTSQAFEKIGGSPWFYKAWYKTRSGDGCGRSHPWLTEQEMADVLNAYIVLQSGGDDRVTPLGNCWDGNPYSMDELKNKANEKGGAVTSISSVVVNYGTNGKTASVKFETNRGAIEIAGDQFYNSFNLRAPARISVKSGLFNLERR